MNHTDLPADLPTENIAEICQATSKWMEVNRGGVIIALPLGLLISGGAACLLKEVAACFLLAGMIFTLFLLWYLKRMFFNHPFVVWGTVEKWVQIIYTNPEIGEKHYTYKIKIHIHQAWKLTDSNIAAELPSYCNKTKTLTVSFD